MQNLNEEPFKVPITPKLALLIVRFLRRYRKHPEALEPFLDSMRGIGVPETNVANVRALMISWRATALDRMAIWRNDRYLLTGTLGLDALLPVLLVLEAPDLPLLLAAVFLVFSLVSMAGSFCVNRVKQEWGITHYGKVHSNVTAFAEASGLAALTAAFWHSSPVLGILVLALAVPAFLLFVWYAALVQIAIGFIRLQNAVTEPAAGVDASPSNESGELTSQKHLGRKAATESRTRERQRWTGRCMDRCLNGRVSIYRVPPSTKAPRPR